MLKWLRRKKEACQAGALPEIDQISDFQELRHDDLMVLFKHSSACPVSWAAHSQINRFRLKHPEVPIYMLNVIRHRPVSQEVAKLTGIRHESPQILIFRGGEVTFHASHGEITEERLTQVLAEAPVPEPVDASVPR